MGSTSSRKTRSSSDKRVASVAEVQEAVLHRVADVLSWHIAQGNIEMGNRNLEQIMETLRQFNFSDSMEASEVRSADPHRAKTAVNERKPGGTLKENK